MHIVLFNDDALPEARGGAAVVADALRRGYAKRGHEVTLITAHKRSEVEERSDNIGRIIRLPAGYDWRTRHRHCVDRNAPVLKVLDDVLRGLKPDAVHAHNVHEYLTYGSLAVAKKYTDRIVLTAHDTFLVSFNRVRGHKYQDSVLRNEMYIMSGWDHLFATGRRYWPFRNRAIVRMLDETGTHVVAISHALRVFLAVNGIPNPLMIHNGTTASPVSGEATASFRKKFGLGDRVVLFGGRLSEDKGSVALLKAFERVRTQSPTAQLLLAGESDRIEKELQSIPPEVRKGIVATGWLSQEDMQAAYAASAVATTPSLYFDPFNLMNIEAMAAGLPVVSTIYGGAPEIVADEETGFIVNPEDTETFANALLQVLEHPEQARQMGERGRARVQKLFTLEAQVDAYLNLLTGQGAARTGEMASR